MMYEPNLYDLKAKARKVYEEYIKSGLKMTPPAKGYGVSFVRFANPRTVDATVYTEVLTGFQFISL